MSKTKEFAAKAETKAASIKLLRWMVREYLGKHGSRHHWDWLVKPQALPVSKGWRAYCQIELTFKKV